MTWMTLTSRSSSAILAHISKKTLERDTILVFALSVNASNIEEIASKLCRVGSQTVIGCLSAAHPESPDSVVCSMATLPRRNCIPFRSSIPGRPPVEVGRWRRNGETPTVPFDIPPLSFEKDNPWGSESNTPLPSELLGHERDIDSLVWFSDNSPEGLMRSLKAIPDANKLGLVAARTPFVTGQPFTLIHNENVYSSGTVGIALRKGMQSTSSVSFPDLIPISAPMKISRSYSNLIYELDNSKPARILMDRTNSNGFPGVEGDIFLGVLHSKSSETKEKMSRVYRVISGDPLRGSIALEAEEAPHENETVQFFHRSSERTSSAKFFSSSVNDFGNHAFQFFCSPSDDAHDRSQDFVEDGVRVLRNKFLAVSDGGLLFTDAISKSLWRCTIPGAKGTLEWAPNSAK